MTLKKGNLMRNKRSTFQRKGGIKGNSLNAASMGRRNLNGTFGPGGRARYLADPKRKRSDGERHTMLLAMNKRKRRGRVQAFGAWA